MKRWTPLKRRTPLRHKSPKTSRREREAKAWTVQTYLDFIQLNRGLFYRLPFTRNVVPCMATGKILALSDVQWEHPKRRGANPGLKWDPMNWGLTSAAFNRAKHDLENGGDEYPEYRSVLLLDFWERRVRRDWVLTLAGWRRRTDEPTGTVQG